MMPLKHILKNKLLLQKHFHTQEFAMDNWPYWLFEENVKLVNEILEEEALVCSLTPFLLILNFYFPYFSLPTTHGMNPFK